MTSGDRIKILRILSGLTQQTLAEYADVSRASVMLWEKGKLPTRRTALALATLFEVSAEFLLEGINPPRFAFWKPVVPGHPRHLQDLEIDMKSGVSPLFSELKIVFSAKGQTIDGKVFWLCGNSPDRNNWRLNYFLIYDKPLDALISNAIIAAVATSIDLEEVFAINDNEALIAAISEKLNKVTGKTPSCNLLDDRLSDRGGDRTNDGTLECLLKCFGREIANNNINTKEIELIANYLAKEIYSRTGFDNIKSRATQLLREAMNQRRLS